MIKEAVFHQAESNYSFPISKNVVVLRLRVAKHDVFEAINVIYGMKYEFYKTQKQASMALTYVDELFAYYEVKIRLDDVRFVYVFKLESKNETYYFCEDGLVDDYDFSLAYFNCFQIPYINESDLHHKVSWIDNAVFYQIFVDRFKQGNFNKDQSYVNLPWGDIPHPKSFAGGDLRGIIDKLSYLKELGINVIYLTPIFSSISNHKYDINDYYKIDPMFGDENDFAELVDRAHKMGMRIVLDAVFNHASSHLKEFQDAVKHGRKSKYFDWFIINGETIDTDKGNYEYFGVSKYMPKWNTSNIEVRDYLINTGKYYIEKYDIDGWRLDVSDEVSHNFWFHFREEIKLIKKDCLIFGENWHDATSFLRGDQFDSIMNYAFTKALFDFLIRQKSNAKGLVNHLNRLLVRNHSLVNQMMLNLLDSHDTHRFFTEANENIDKLLQGLAILFMFIGAPCIYYGTEIPLAGGYDPDNRRCFPWDKLNENSTYFNRLKQIIALKQHEVVRQGDINIFEKNQLFVIKRYLGNHTVTLYVNATKDDIDMELSNVILAHRVENNTLCADGFVILEEKQ